VREGSPRSLSLIPSPDRSADNRPLGFATHGTAPYRAASALVAVLVLGIIVVGAIVAVQGSSPLREPGTNEYCFAEWCITPQSATTDGHGITIQVRVRSDAKQASQRPDHPQAWLIEATGGQIGGPQPSLDDQLGPGDSYVATLGFNTSQPGACPMLMVSEGGWPPFLGLGYTPSPFTTRVDWRVCETAG
jgi:hypothetical protein